MSLNDSALFLVIIIVPFKLLSLEGHTCAEFNGVIDFAFSLNIEFVALNVPLINGFLNNYLFTYLLRLVHEKLEEKS